jgi:mycothiol synthase
MTFTLRPVTPEDLPAVHALCRAIEQADAVPIATPIEEFEEWLGHPHLDLAADTRVAERDGELVAWGYIWHRPSDEREHRAFAIGGVSAAHRGLGVGRALLGWQIARATDRLRNAQPDLPRHVRTWAYDFQASAHRLYERFGLQAVRWGEELILDLARETPAVPEPGGIRIVPWDAAYSEAARLAQNDAFLDHWGTPPVNEVAWAHDLTAHGSRLDLSFLALEGERVVGVCHNSHHPSDEAVTGRRDGWIGRVSVVRSHRGRGIASALIAASLQAFRAEGFTHSMLGVDRDNPTGAYTLYQRLGYRTLTRTMVRQLEV